MASIKQRPDGKWRARYRDAGGKEHSRHFPRKIDAQRWLDEVTAAVLTGQYVDPKTARTTVGEWAAVWLKGYSKRPSTVRQAKIHLARITAAFGARPLSSVRPSDVRSWTAALKDEGLADSTVYALHKRLGQLYADAVHDGIVPKSPVSRRTSPGAGAQRPYVATTEQVWALYEAMPAHARPGILLGAFAGLRVAEAVALRTKDVDFMRGVIAPAVQYPAEPLKTKASMEPVPVPRDLALMLNRNPAELGSETIVASEWGRMMSITTFETLFRAARDTVEGLPVGFRFHDLRHYFASLLISQGLDVKIVQKCMRHGSAKTTLDTYGHLWPDKEESARAAVQTVLAARADSVRTEASGT
jgi:integrase